MTSPSLSTTAKAATSNSSSANLRFSSSFLSNDREWKEKSEGIIRKPNVSPAVFTTILHYLYTGRKDTIDITHIIDVIAAAEEMELDKLSIECQREIIVLCWGHRNQQR